MFRHSVDLTMCLLFVCVCVCVYVCLCVRVCVCCSFMHTVRILSKDLGAKIRDLQSGQSVSLGHVTLASLGKDGETLNCDEVCLQVERNRALAAALGISSPVVNPLEPSLPRYSDALLELARYVYTMFMYVVSKDRDRIERAAKYVYYQVT